MIWFFTIFRWLVILNFIFIGLCYITVIFRVILFIASYTSSSICCKLYRLPNRNTTSICIFTFPVDTPPTLTSSPCIVKLLYPLSMEFGYKRKFYFRLHFKQSTKSGVSKAVWIIDIIYIIYILLNIQFMHVHTLLPTYSSLISFGNPL